MREVNTCAMKPEYCDLYNNVTALRFVRDKSRFSVSDIYFPHSRLCCVYSNGEMTILSRQEAEATKNIEGFLFVLFNKYQYFCGITSSHSKILHYGVEDC